jgi:site-specific DNA recombinase
MRAALYSRVSTNEQNASMQVQELRAYCERRGWAIAEGFTDAISGSKESRPGLNRLLADAKRRKFAVVLVYRYDRFARSLRQCRQRPWSHYKHKFRRKVQMRRGQRTHPG